MIKLIRKNFKLILVILVISYLLLSLISNFLDKKNLIKDISALTYLDIELIKVRKKTLSSSNTFSIKDEKVIRQLIKLISEKELEGSKQKKRL